MKIENLKNYDELRVLELDNDLDFEGTKEFLNNKLQDFYRDYENCENLIDFEIFAKHYIENEIQKIINEDTLNICKNKGFTFEGTFIAKEGEYND